jgi:DNA-binding beta-propeller fold protein YncE
MMKRIIAIFLLLVLPIPASSKSSLDFFEFGSGILKYPFRIHANANGVYVCDTILKAVLKFDNAGRLISRTDGGQISSPTGIAELIDGDLAICDSKLRQVKIFDPNLKFLRNLDIGQNVNLDEPYDICVDGNGIINILDRGQRKVFLVGSSGKYLGQYASAGIGENQLAFPLSIASNGKETVVADAGLGKLLFFSSKNRETRRIGFAGSGPTSIRYPTDVAFDHEGNLLVTDRILSDLTIYPATGTAPFSYGRFGAKGNQTNLFYSEIEQGMNQQDPASCMNNPMSADVYGGCVYVADAGNSRVMVARADQVFEQPRVSSTPFTSLNPDIPSMFVNPTTADFGTVALGKTYVRTITLNLSSSGFISGKASVAGNFFRVEPNHFIGSKVTFYIIHKPESPGINNANLAFELDGARMDIPIRAFCSKEPGFRFSNMSQNLVSVSNEQSVARLFIETDKGFSKKLAVNCLKPTYSTSWSKVARGLDELTLSTLSCELSEQSGQDFEGKVFDISFVPIGFLRPGVYNLKINAFAETETSKTSFGITIIVMANPIEAISTQILEEFTAHWCEPCGYQREATYRVFQEYGPRSVQPVAYHVMDDGDLETTGMTRPENYERFTMYGGTGVPLNLINGEPQKVYQNGKQLAYDRLRGRKYSGTSNDYLKMRGDLDLLSKKLPYQMNVWGTFEKGSGRIKIETPNFDFNKDTDHELIVLLVEDNIEYNSANGENIHHFVVRSILNDYWSNKISEDRTISFDYSIPKMPEGFEPDSKNCRIVAFLQNKKTLKVQSVGWHVLQNVIDEKPQVFLDSRQPAVSPNASIPLTIYVSNISDRWKEYSFNLVLPDNITADHLEGELLLSSNSTVIQRFILDTSKVSDFTSQVSVELWLNDDENIKTLITLKLPTRIGGIQ